MFPLRVYDRGEHSGFLTPHSRNCHGDPAKGKDGLPWGIGCDLGAYGAPRDVKEGKVWDAKGSVRAMEHWTRDKGGWQACYTDMFCTHREFRQMFNHELMDKVGGWVRANWRGRLGTSREECVGTDGTNQREPSSLKPPQTTATFVTSAPPSRSPPPRSPPPRPPPPLPPPLPPPPPPLRQGAHAPGCDRRVPCPVHEDEA